MFGWLKRRRRRRILEQPFPAAWEAAVSEHVWQYGHLTAGEQAALRDRVQVFVAEKNFEGCGGLDLTDEVRVAVAACAGLLILELDPDSYDHVESVLVYPGDYVAPRTTVTRDGLMRDEESLRAGEAWTLGVVVLSWEDFVRRGRGRNVAIHEFAHQLDMLNRDVDGTPPLRDGAAVAEWRRVMTRQYRHLVRDVERGRRTFLDPYAATDPAEFFAVVTESFFETPVELRDRLPGVYAMCREYYRQDPAAWFDRAGPGA